MLFEDPTATQYVCLALSCNDLLFASFYPFGLSGGNK
jgi:hypothetical protein